MLTKTLRGAMIAGVALAASFGFTGAASATADSAAASAPAVADVVPQADLDETLPDTNIGNDLCLLPWFWPGPFNVLTEGQTGVYSACNTTPEMSSFGNALMQYETIKFMIDQEMLDESAFEAFLKGDVTSHEVIIDEDALNDITAGQTEAAGEEGGIGNDACILPWLWQGPLNFLTEGQTAYYEACNE